MKKTNKQTKKKHSLPKKAAYIVKKKFEDTKG